MNEKHKTIQAVAIWISVAIAVSIGILITHSAICLWAFVFAILARW